MLNDSFDAVLDEGANSSTSNSACSSEEKPKKDWMKPNVVGKSTPPPPDSDEENSASDSDDDGLFTLGKKIAHKKPISAGPQPFSLGMLAKLRKEQQQTAALKKSCAAGIKEKKRTKKRTKDPLLDDFLTSSEEDDEIASDSGDDDAPKVINGRSQINKNDVDDEFALKLDESNSIIPSPTKRLRSQKIDKKACELGEKLKFAQVMAETERKVRKRHEDASSSSAAATPKVNQAVIPEISLQDDSPKKPNDSSWQSGAAGSRKIVKFLKGANAIIRFGLSGGERFASAYREIAVRLKIPASELVLRYNNCDITPADTPDSINYNIADVIEVYRVANYEDGAAAKNSETKDSETLGETGDLIEIKFQTVDRKSSINMKVKKTHTFEMISQQYRAKRGLDATTKIRFVFDGEAIEPDQTPDDLEIEDEDCVDVQTGR